MPDLTSYKPFGVKGAAYSKAMVPFYPEDDWGYGGGYTDPYTETFTTYGIFTVGGTDGMFANNFGIDSYGSYIQNIVSTPINSEEYNGTPYNTAMRFYGNLDFRVLIVFRLNQTSGFRFFYGLNSESPLFASTDDILGINSAHGFGLLVQENGNFKITSNNGSGTSYITSDIATIDTNVHKIYLESDSGNTRWGYSFDGSPVTYISTQNPSGTALIQPYYVLRNREAGVQKTFNIYMIRGMQKYKL